MNRRTFLHPGKTVENSSPPTAGLEPYSGVWTTKQALHLLRRTTFGVSKAELDLVLSKGMSSSVDALLDNTNDPIPSPPLNLYSTPTNPDPTTPYGTTFVNAPALTTIPPEYYQLRTNMVKAWWTGNMIHQKMTLTEKMTLFWFNHFAIEADKIIIAQALYYYYKLLRDNAFGDFKILLKGVSLHPAMLFYLNGDKNGKAAPDENYGRELQELFTVGKGTDSNYTEDDVKAAAKVLTGFRINPLTTPLSYYFDFNQHDATDKTFSAFYKNTTIKGQTFLQGEQELDALLTMLLDNVETARHLCRKLYRFFVYYEITPEAESNVIIPLADYFKSTGYNIKKTLEKLFKSAHFYEEASIGCVIKSPFDYAVGLCKEFSIDIPDSTQKENQYISWGTIAAIAAAQGQNIADPPVVSGWQAWYQFPQFHRIWINADSLAIKNKVADALVSANGLNLIGVALKIDSTKIIFKFGNADNADALVRSLVSYFYNYTLSDSSINYFKNFLTGGVPNGEIYWKNIVDAYIANPSPTNLSPVETRAKSLIKEILTQSEYHLS